MSFGGRQRYQAAAPQLLPGALAPRSHLSAPRLARGRNYAFDAVTVTASLRPK